MSSISPGRLRCVHSGIAAFALFFAVGAQAQAEYSLPDPFAVVPFYDPQGLQEIASLDDETFLNRLFGSSGNVLLIDQLFPPDLPVFPISHGFAGVQQACRRTGNTYACRLHVDDLISINQRHTAPSRVHVNPFEPLR
jgi:hypothetical protein